jgi:hypothetical protein
MVSNYVFVTIVDECVSEETKCLRKNEADFIFTTELIDVY